MMRNEYIELLLSDIIESKDEIDTCLICGYVYPTPKEDNDCTTMRDHVLNHAGVNSEKKNLILCKCVLSVGNLESMIKGIKEERKATYNGTATTKTFNFEVDIKTRIIY